MLVNQNPMRKHSGGTGVLGPVWPRDRERPAARGPSSQAVLGQRHSLDPMSPWKVLKCSEGAGLLGGGWCSSDHRPGNLPPLPGQEATSYVN